MERIYKLHLERKEVLTIIDALKEYRKKHNKVLSGNFVDQYALYIDGVSEKCQQLIAFIDADLAVRAANEAKNHARNTYMKLIKGCGLESGTDDDLPFEE